MSSKCKDLYLYCFNSSGVPGKSLEQIGITRHGQRIPFSRFYPAMVVGHSNPKKLKADAVEAQRLSPRKFERCRVKIKGLMENLWMPSNVALMKKAIADVNNSSFSTEGHFRALLELLDLGGPIDNENDLNKIGRTHCTSQKTYQRRKLLSLG